MLRHSPVYPTGITCCLCSRSFTLHCVFSLLDAEAEVRDYLHQAARSRVTAATRNNDESSRSHAIFLLQVSSSHNATSCMHTAVCSVRRVLHMPHNTSAHCTCPTGDDQPAPA